MHIVCQLENIIQFYCHEVNICSGAQSADLIWIFQTKWNIIVLSNIMNKWKVTLIKSSVEPVHRSNPNKQNLIITNRITSEQLPVLFTHLYIRHAACLQPFIFYFTTSLLYYLESNHSLWLSQLPKSTKWIRFGRLSEQSGSESLTSNMQLQHPCLPEANHAKLRTQSLLLQWKPTRRQRQTACRQQTWSKARVSINS